MTGAELERIERDAPRRAPESTSDLLLALLRLTGGVWLRTAAWGLGASVRLARTARDPRLAGALLSEVGEGLRGYAREFLGVDDLDEQVRRATPAGPPAESAPNRGVEIEALRARGAELLRRSADVNVDQSGHPAYVRILEELAPDEARILRLLYSAGAQPAVDVRSVQLMGLGTHLIAEGLNMTGAQSGCLYPERVPAYLNNLNRLGLVWFSKEPLEDPIAYQVLEAQPDVLGALKSVPRAKTVQRSIRLTPFGADFCEVCLPADAGSRPIL